MKIVAINGSHRGRSGNTNAMVTAILKGASEAGAETVNIVLAEKNIKHCVACKACWFKSPGQCVLDDDMSDILSLMEGADVRLLATPIYCDNISGMLKVFIDRMIVTISPYWEKDADGECRHLPAIAVPKLVMVANCGYPEKSHFQVISHWIKRQARNMNTEILGEIYVSQGALLSNQIEELHPLISNYLTLLEVAGREIVTNQRLSEKTMRLLEPKFIPDEIYIQEVKRIVDVALKNIAV
jgi:multimeric flavodoxin WrbA